MSGSILTRQLISMEECKSAADQTKTKLHHLGLQRIAVEIWTKP